MRYKRFVTFNCQKLLNRVKQMNIADDFCHLQLIAMIIQETHTQGHGIHQLEPSSREKPHLYFSGHENRSSAGTGINSKTKLKCQLHTSFQKSLHDES